LKFNLIDAIYMSRISIFIYTC